MLAGGLLDQNTPHAANAHCEAVLKVGWGKCALFPRGAVSNSLNRSKRRSALKMQNTR